MDPKPLSIAASILLHGAVISGAYVANDYFSAGNHDLTSSVDVELVKVLKPAVQKTVVQKNIVSQPKKQGRKSQANSKQVVGTSGRADPSIILTSVAPVYPKHARRQRLEGTVQLCVVLNGENHPDSVWIFKSSGHNALDFAALDAVKQWRFAKGSGRHEIIVPVEFRLKN